MFRRVCVFCGSSSGNRAEYAAAAVNMAECLVKSGIGIVYGGGKVGLMGRVADAALNLGGEVIGVMPQALVNKELAHPQLSNLHIVASMHERKALMADLSDAFIALPGGFGTFEEFCEVLTWTQLGVHRKACGLLNVGGYYDPLLELFDHAVRDEFLRPEHRRIVISEADPQALMARLLGYTLPSIEKWIDRREE